MGIEKLNFSVQPRDKAKAEDFNKVIRKIDEIIEQGGAIPEQEIAKLLSDYVKIKDETEGVIFERGEMSMSYSSGEDGRLTINTGRNTIALSGAWLSFNENQVVTADITGVLSDFDDNVPEKNTFVGAINSIADWLAITDNKVNGLDVSPDDKILTMDEGYEIHSHLTLSYDKEGQTLSLRGVDGVEVDSLDVSDFVIDKTLSDVSIIENKDGQSGIWMKFVWNTDAGNKELYVDVSKFFKTYTSGDSTYISVDNTTHKISAVIGDSSKAGLATFAQVNGKQDKLSFNTEYNASTNKVATMSDIEDAMDASSDRFVTTEETDDVQIINGEKAFLKGLIVENGLEVGGNVWFSRGSITIESLFEILRYDATAAILSSLRDKFSLTSSETIEFVCKNLVVNKGSDNIPEVYNIYHEGNLDITQFVEKVSGKGLSTNDYTTADKNKVASALPFNNTYCSNANTHLDNGYIKVGKYSGNNFTQNIPSVCTGDDRWGILFFIAENATDGTGTQMYFPIDGTYKGRVFTRSLTAAKKTGQSNYNIGEWTLLATSKDLSGYVKSEAISDMLTKTEARDTYLGKTANASSATKLANSRTLWGQSFDGSGDVSGAISRAESVGRDGNNLIDFANTQSNKAYGGVWTWTRGADSNLIAYLDNNGLLLKRPWLRLQDRVTYIDREALYYNDGKLYLNGSNAYIDLNGNQTLQGGLSMNGVLSGARGLIKEMNNSTIFSRNNYTYRGITYNSLPDGRLHIKGKHSNPDNEGASSYIFSAETISVLQGHRYLIYIGAIGSEECRMSTSDWRMADNGGGRIYTASTTTSSYSLVINIYHNNVEYDDIIAPLFTDLTAMFGSGLEPTTATEFANRLGYASIEDVPYIPYGTTELNNAMAIGGDLVVNGTPLKGDMIAIKTQIEATSETTKVLEVGKVVNFGEVTTLNISLAEPTQTDVVNEYGFVFTAGVSNMTYTLPTSVKWEVGKGAPTITEGHTYRVTIIDNCATYNEFE